jgi:hypothetical protein
LKISKDQVRLLKLLKNRYLNDSVFLKLLKLYNWNDQGLYDNDENRDVATALVERFSKLQQINHNIQHSPIGIYYTALETNSSVLLDSIYYMPSFEISDKNAHENQPLNLKQVCAMNPNISKPLMMQILKDNDTEVLKFLALNQSLGKIVIDKLLEKNDTLITKNLLETSLVEEKKLKKLFVDPQYQKIILSKTILDDKLFELFLSFDLKDIDVFYLSSNESLSADHIKKLFDLNIPNVNINLLKNSYCPPNILEKFLQLNDLTYHIAIAHNETLSSNIVDELIKIDDININISLASNSVISKTAFPNRSILLE